MDKIKAILFDFDGVLTMNATGSASICNYVSAQAKIPLETFESAYRECNDDLLYGKIKHSDIWEDLCRSLNSNIDIKLLYDSFINTPLDKTMLTYAERLKRQGYKIGMITDNKADRINTIIKHFKLSPLFDTVCVSAIAGSGKDGVLIFEKALNGLRLSANECVFIDNHEKNLIIPKQMGMEAIYFNHIKRDYKLFESQLENFGVRSY